MAPTHALRPLKPQAPHAPAAIRGTATPVAPRGVLERVGHWISTAWRKLANSSKKADVEAIAKVRLLPDAKRRLTADTEALIPRLMDIFNGLIRDTDELLRADSAGYEKVYDDDQITTSLDNAYLRVAQADISFDAGKDKASAALVPFLQKYALGRPGWTQMLLELCHAEVTGIVLIRKVWQNIGSLREPIFVVKDDGGFVPKDKRRFAPADVDWENMFLVDNGVIDTTSLGSLSIYGGIRKPIDRRDFVIHRWNNREHTLGWGAGRLGARLYRLAEYRKPLIHLLLQTLENVGGGIRFAKLSETFFQGKGVAQQAEVIEYVERELNNAISGDTVVFPAGVEPVLFFPPDSVGGAVKDAVDQYFDKLIQKQINGTSSAEGDAEHSSFAYGKEVQKVAFRRDCFRAAVLAETLDRDYFSHWLELNPWVYRTAGVPMTTPRPRARFTLGGGDDLEAKARVWNSLKVDVSKEEYARQLGFTPATKEEIAAGESFIPASAGAAPQQPPGMPGAGSGFGGGGVAGSPGSAPTNPADPLALRTVRPWYADIVESARRAAPARDPSHWGSKAQPFWRPGPNPTVDNVITRDNPQTGKPEVLLIKRAETNKHGEPVAEGGKWALPGGFHDSDTRKGEAWKPGKETAAQAALRELQEETGLDAGTLKAAMKHVGQYGDVKKSTGRDPRDNKESWSVSNAFHLHLTPELASKAVAGTDDASDAKWVPLDEAHKAGLAFDHNKILSAAVPSAKAAPTTKGTPAKAAKATLAAKPAKFTTEATLRDYLKQQGLSSNEAQKLVWKTQAFAEDKKGRPIAGKKVWHKAEVDKAIKNIEFDRGPGRAAPFDESKHPRASDGKFGSGGGGSSTATADEDEPEVPELTKPGEKAKATAMQRVGQAVELWKKTQVAAQVAKAIVTETGASPKMADAAFWIAAVGDIPIPGVPVGSIAVSAVASIIKPSAGAKAATKAGKAIAGAVVKFAKWAAGKGDLKKKGPTPDEVIAALKEQYKGQYAKIAAMPATRAAELPKEISAATKAKATAIAKRFAKYDEEYALAIINAALVQTDGDVDEALDLAEEFLKDNPTPPAAEDDDTSN